MSERSVVESVTHHEGLKAARLLMVLSSISPLFDGIEDYAAKRPRAARYLASIRAQGETKRIDKALLKRLCKQTGVDVTEANGKVTVDPGHEMGFLEVLDRRRYEVSLVKEKPERYRAASRRKISEG